MSINRVNISGNLTRDPELRATQNGMQVLSFGVAVNDRTKNQQTGEWEDRPNFVDCTMFGKRAEALSRILRKGMKVAIEGKLRYSAWEKDGQKRSKLEVIPDEVELMSQGQQQGGYQQYAQPAPQGYQPQQYAPAPQQYAQPQQYAPQPYQGAPAAPPQQAPAPAPQPQQYAPAPQQAPAPAPQQAPQQMDLYDEDIPF